MASRYSITKAVLEKRWNAATIAEMSDDTDALVDQAIELAEGEFEGFAGVYYALPVRDAADAVPPVVTAKLSGAAMWFLASRKPEWTADTEQSNTFLRVRKEVTDWYRGLAAAKDDNRIRIPDAVEREASQAAGEGAWATSREALYRRDQTREVF